MLTNLKEERAAQFKTVFFTLKILAMFFFSIPLIEYLMDKTSDQPVNLNEFSTSLLIVFVLLSAIAFIWILMDKKRYEYKAIPMLEIISFFIMCLASIFCSGGIASYYKFVFVFLIVLYTFEFGMKLGMTIAIVSSITLLTFDLLLFDQSGVNSYFENDLVLSAVFIIVAWALGFYVKMEQIQITQLRSDANIDGLTQVYNHRFFYERIQILCSDTQVIGGNLSLLMIDIDHFKTYNDIYGHQQGDNVLKFLSQLLKQAIDKDDILCRYGGEEFAIILKDKSLLEAMEYAKKIRETVENSYFQGQEHMPNGNFTVSIGVSEFLGVQDNYNDFINRADSALYRAKFLRRNSVEAYSSIFDELNTMDSRNSNIQDNMQSLKTLITVINSRDSYTFNHVERVVYLCREVSNILELPEHDKKKLLYAAYLHDLGKINISKEILITDKPLTSEQWEELKTHPVESANIVKSVPGFEEYVPIIRQHHERYDGTGYPDQLKGEEICYLARILTIIDSFDAMTSKRPYQAMKSYEQAFDEIRRCSGTQFDPTLSEKIIEAIRVSLKIE